ncbi:MAG: DNA-processing protein DprA [Armatimonadota bacterium]|nr:DNA-processing protein DprA [Armatimonadota bacterium]MDR7577915.1 DNA-processing protein DprA [Armatimonadota bacterium]
MTEREAWVLLNAAPGVSVRVKHRLVEAAGSAQGAVALGAPTLAELVGQRCARRLWEFLRRVRPAALLEDASRCGAQVVTLADPEYPQALREIPDPPLALYVRGRLPDGVRVAVVGSRNPSPDGEYVARRMAAELAAAGVCVVSGLARGIDAAAHRGALEVRGPTVAVLGCGVDVGYPAGHEDLADQVAACGAVVSEYPPGTPPAKHHFPLRNRLISGLSHAVVVVEATLRSGALITADLALEQGREVFAVPGSVLNPRSAGPHRLLREGAGWAESAADVLQALGIAPGPSPQHPVGPLEARVLECLREPRFPDELVGAGLGTAGAVSALLVSLEVRGLVQRLPGGRYVSQVGQQPRAGGCPAEENGARSGFSHRDRTRTP